MLDVLIRFEKDNIKNRNFVINRKFVGLNKNQLEIPLLKNYI